MTRRGVREDVRRKRDRGGDKGSIRDFFISKKIRYSN